MGSLQQIIESGLKTRFGGASLPPHMWRAAQRMTLCRTAALGGHVQACPEGHEERHWYNSCKHRSCPTCNYTSTERWLARQQTRVLDCDYYHVIITVDSALDRLWLANGRSMTDILFRAARDTIFELMGDPKHLGAEPGVIIALHTWGQMQGLTEVGERWVDVYQASLAYEKTWCFYDKECTKSGSRGS